MIISRFCGQEPGRRASLDIDMEDVKYIWQLPASFSYFWLVNYLILHRPPIIYSPASHPTLSIFCWFSLTKSWVEEHDSAHLISWFPIRHSSNQVLIISSMAYSSSKNMKCNIIMMKDLLALSLIHVTKHFDRIENLISKEFYYLYFWKTKHFVG